MPRISIVTPSYNQGRYLRRTIESVLRQRGDFDLEHIVVDGGSTDDSLAILRSYGDRVRWVSEPDDGQADALNKGFVMATGEILGWINSDDVYEPECLQTVAGLFASEPHTQWLYGKVRVIDDRGLEIRRFVTWYKNRRMRRFSYARLLTENWISQMGVFWRNSAGRQAGPFRKELQHAMDYDFWLRLGAQWPGRFVDRYLAAFRWYSASKSGRCFLDQTREALEVAIRHANGQYPYSLACHRINRAKIVGACWLLRAWGACSGHDGDHSADEISSAAATNADPPQA